MLIAQYFNLLFLPSFSHFFSQKPFVENLPGTSFYNQDSTNTYHKRSLPLRNSLSGGWYIWLISLYYKGKLIIPLKKIQVRLFYFLDAINFMPFFEGFLFWSCSGWLYFSFGSSWNIMKGPCLRVCWSALHNDCWLYGALRWRTPLGSHIHIATKL